MPRGSARSAPPSVRRVMTACCAEIWRSCSLIWSTMVERFWSSIALRASLRAFEVGGLGVVARDDRGHGA